VFEKLNNVALKRLPFSVVYKFAASNNILIIASTVAAMGRFVKISSELTIKTKAKKIAICLVMRTLLTILFDLFIFFIS